MGQHVPERPGVAHETQPPWQETLQQTPSAQKPDAQSAAAVHCAPFIFLPQLPATHCCVLTHWLDCVHDSKHAPLTESHEYGAQIVVGPGRQRPAPSHANAPVTASPSQVPALQIVPATWRRHAPAPSHLPSKPHVEAAAALHVVASRGSAPATSAVHVPTEPTALQVLQPSLQAVLQQTPSVQWPLAQSASQPHAWATARLVAASLLQTAASGAVTSEPPPSRASVGASRPSDMAAASASGRVPLEPPQPATTTSASPTIHSLSRIDSMG
jgi:hypothetical protein